LCRMPSPSNLEPVANRHDRCPRQRGTGDDRCAPADAADRQRGGHLLPGRNSAGPTASTGPSCGAQGATLSTRAVVGSGLMSQCRRRPAGKVPGAAKSNSPVVAATIRHSGASAAYEARGTHRGRVGTYSPATTINGCWPRWWLRSASTMVGGRTQLRRTARKTWPCWPQRRLSSCPLFVRGRTLSEHRRGPFP
jgi:hypothetical protein